MALGRNVVNTRSLAKSTELSAFDPGSVSTTSYESKVAYIDDDKGLLYYRDYPIEQLAEKSDRLEAYYLLIHDGLPTSRRRVEFEYTMRHYTMVHKQLTWSFHGPRRDVHPMATMVGVAGALSAFYQDSLGTTNPEHRKTAAYRLISKAPTIAVMCYRCSNGSPLNYPRNNPSYSGNLMHMMFAMSCRDYKPSPVLARTLDRTLILHVDHEQNTSASTVRLAGSSDANLPAYISAGIVRLWNVPHGGANEVVLLMLDGVGDVPYVTEYVEGVKQYRYHLMGFGHYVYRNVDPHTSIMCQACYEVLKELNLEGNLRPKLAMELEKIALKDLLLVEHKLCLNVDLHSGIVSSALDIPTSMSTVTFAPVCSVSQISHQHEVIGGPSPKIGRPRQLHTGTPRRDSVPPE